MRSPMDGGMVDTTQQTFSKEDNDLDGHWGCLPVFYFFQDSDQKGMCVWAVRSM